VGGPERSQAGKDQRARRGKQRVQGSRKRLAAAVGEGTPEGARGAGQGSSSTEWPSLKQLQQFQSQPASQ